MGRRDHHCDEEINYDERYIDHGADDCRDRAGGMDRYHDYEYYAQERAYSNQSSDIYNKAHEYESSKRQQEQSAYEQYLHLKSLGIDEKIYGRAKDEFVLEEQETSDKSVSENFQEQDATDEDALKQEERRKLMLEAQAAMKEQAAQQEAMCEKKGNGFLGYLLTTIGLFVGSIGTIIIGFFAFAFIVMLFFWLLKCLL